MKKFIFVISLSLLLTSCGVVSAAGSVVGGTIKAAGTVTGAVIKTTGKIIGSVIGGSDSEVKVKDTKYKFSDVEMEVDQYSAVVTGKLSHNGSTKKNLRLSIPCFDKDGNRVGDAIATIDELEKDKKWEFRAVLNEPNVVSCKIKDAYITVD
ncbi:FxLYD domain-containing protein [Fusobacterium simiae]|uniref:FxLYD domain-containing protein n=1 Tax=Fusobacterium simiae TaxID=855 RepID=A0ABT4DHV3_FUSSI|nr:MULTISPECIES: FxLYD domain-containing protein [Fusobacterium]MCY7008182.1 FxLYD domain-containing protein [Fusobacterium simiae]MDC7954740.1 FxLYD domain-containing protein [Fusobacterium simiae]